METMNFKRTSLKAARRELVDAGLIDVVTGHQGMATLYRVNNQFNPRVAKATPIKKIGAVKATPIRRLGDPQSNSDIKKGSELNLANSDTAEPRHTSIAPDSACDETRRAIRCALAVLPIPRGPQSAIDETARAALDTFGMSAAEYVAEVMDKIPRDEILANRPALAKMFEIAAEAV
jgi:hypothetical protein